jgi:hypothetical protein
MGCKEMKTPLKCMFLVFGACLTLGCAFAAKESLLETQLISIREAEKRVLYNSGAEDAEQMELWRSRELLRFTAVSLKRGFTGEEFEDFEKAKLTDGIVGVDFIFVFENETDYILISDLFVPHIDNFGPMSTLASTKGFYILHIEKSGGLAKEIGEKIHMFGGEGARIQGSSVEMEEKLKMFVERGIKVQGRSYDGARLDTIEVNDGYRHLMRRIINPHRPTDSKEKYVDEDIEATDAIFQLLWSHFM